jgi:hypothetical protein
MNLSLNPEARPAASPPPPCPVGLPAAEACVDDARMQIDGATIWRQITAAVQELQRARRPDEAMN